MFGWQKKRGTGNLKRQGGYRPVDCGGIVVKSNIAAGRGGTKVKKPRRSDYV
jgi:hypothetical protein